jgi:hypothetical protein
MRRIGIETRVLGENFEEVPSRGVNCEVGEDIACASETGEPMKKSAKISAPILQPEQILP